MGASSGVRLAVCILQALRTDTGWSHDVCAALMQQKRVRHGTTCVLRSLALVAHHGLVEEWEPLHGGECVGRGRDVRKHNPGLPPQPVGLHAYDVQDLSELGEYGVQTFLQLCREGHKKVSAENAKAVRAQRD